MVAGYASAGPAAFWLRYTWVRWKGASLFFVCFLNERLPDGKHWS